MNDWIHTRRGVTLVEGTLPALVKGIKELTTELKRLNDHNKAQNEERSNLHRSGSSAPPNGLDQGPGNSSTGGGRAQDS